MEPRSERWFFAERPLVRLSSNEKVQLEPLSEASLGNQRSHLRGNGWPMDHRNGSLWRLHRPPGAIGSGHRLADIHVFDYHHRDSMGLGLGRVGRRFPSLRETFVGRSCNSDSWNCFIKCGPLEAFWPGGRRSVIETAVKVPGTTWSTPPFAPSWP